MGKLLFKTDTGRAIKSTVKTYNDQGRMTIVDDVKWKGNPVKHAEALAKKHGPSGALGIIDRQLGLVPGNTFWTLARKTVEKILKAQAAAKQ